MVIVSERRPDGRLFGSLPTLLPSESALAGPSWSLRHRAVTVVLWGHVLAVLACAVVANRSGVDLLGDATVVLVPAAITSMPRYSRSARSIFAVLGLAICCELLIAYAGGSNDVDILLLLMVVVSALYRSWPPFLLTIGLVALHYVVLLLVSAYAASGQPAALTDVWRYVGLRDLFFAGAALLALASWRLEELTRADGSQAPPTPASAAADTAQPASALDAGHAPALDSQPRHLVDTLTGLSTRTAFMQTLAEACRRGTGERALAVLLLDVDRFKVIKSSLGAQVGDALLVNVGQRLRRHVDSADAVARYMADVFMLLLDDVADLEQARRKAEAILVDLARPFRLDGREVTTTANIGLAFARPGIAPIAPEELARHADVALYTAKSIGRNRVEIYDPSTDALTPERLELESDLHHAIDRHELMVYYQPIVRLSDMRLCRLEALVRWRHSSLGTVPPDRFIPIAEETGLIVPLGRWVLRQAAFQTAAWRRQRPSDPPLGVSVNVSPVELRQPALLDIVAQTLHDADLPASAVTLEITESAVVGEEEGEALTLLHRQGIRLVVDDFGIGYSSLSYLHRLPVACLKIDRAFVRSMESDRGSASIVRAIVDIARSLNLQITAEGIETTSQLELLREAGCDFGQGYLFGPALPVSEVERLLLPPVPAGAASSPAATLARYQS